MSVEENYETAENIIRAVTIFGDDKKLLKGWLKRNCPSLDERQTAAVCRLSFSGWGSLSKTLLTEIYSPDENGEARSIMDMLRSTDNNLMQLLSNSFKFAENAEAHLKEKCGERESLREMIEDTEDSARGKAQPAADRENSRWNNRYQKIRTEKNNDRGCERSRRR